MTALATGSRNLPTVAASGGLLSGVVRRPIVGAVQQRSTRLEQFVAGGPASGSAIGGSRISLPEYRMPAYLYSWIYACINRVARPGSNVRYSFFNEDAKTGQRQEVKDHPALVRLLDPNPTLYPSFSAMLWQCIVNLLVGGNSMFYYSKQRTSDGLPAMITALSRRNCGVIRDRRTNSIAGWNIVIGQDRFPVPRELVSQIRYPTDPDSGDLCWGVGPITALHDEMDTDGAARVWNKSVFKSGVNLDTTLLYRPRREQDDSWLNDDQLDSLERALKDEMSGAHNAGGFRILNGPFEMIQRGALQRDVEFIEAGRVTREAYAGVIGVPLILVFPDGAGLAEAAVKVARVMLWEDAIIPVLGMIQDVLQRDWVDQYAPGFKGYFVTEEIPALREDMGRIADECKKWAGLNIPMNDLIDVYGLRFKKQPWNDEPLVSGFVQPISRIFDKDDEDESANPLAAEDTGETDPIEDEGDGEPDAAAKEKAKEVEDAKEEQQEAADYKHLVRTVDGKRQAYRLKGRMREAYRRAFGKLWEPLEAAASRAYLDHAAEIETEVAAKLATVAASRAVRASGDASFDEPTPEEIRRGKRLAKKVLFDRKKASRNLKAAFGPILEQSIEVGVKSAAADLDAAEAIGINSEATAQLLENKLSKITRIDDYIEKQIFDELTDGFARGETAQDLAKRLNTVMGELTSPYRSRMIARTEVGGALNGGRFAEFQAQGVRKIEWLSADDEHVRVPKKGSPFNHKIDGTVVRIGQKFMKTGGRGVRYPGDPDGEAGNVIHCVPGDTLVEGRVLVALRARYAGQVVELETRHGRRLRVTPNHPVLTDRGFVPAHALREGDHVVCHGGDVHPGGIARPTLHEPGAGVQELHDQQAPARIEDVFRAFAQAGSLRLAPVLGDLDGDARRFQGEIEVVAADGELLRDLHASFAQRAREVVLEGTSLHAASGAGGGVPFALGLGLALAAHRVPRLRELPGDGHRAGAPGRAVRIGASSQLDVSRYEAAGERRAADSALARELQEAGAGLVSLDQVAQVRCVDFLGHVYDLQTELGWFTAGNITTRNCRCTVLPVVEAQAQAAGYRKERP